MQATNTIEEIKLFSIYSRAQATECEEKSLRLEAESELLRNCFGILADITFPYRLSQLSRSVKRTVERWTSGGDQLFNSALVQNAPQPAILDQLLVQYVDALKAVDKVIVFMENEDRRSRWLKSALARLKSRREELAAAIDQIRAKYNLHDSLKRFITIADVAQQKKLKTADTGHLRARFDCQRSSSLICQRRYASI
jgi:hypothetical protein